MKKLVLILPILFSLLIFVGAATAETQERVNSSNFMTKINWTGLGNSACTFAKAADDGGALGEKAKCQAMLENPQNESWINANTTDSCVSTVKPVFVTGLTAIREDEA